MNVTPIIKALAGQKAKAQAEIDRIDEALTALTRLSSAATLGRKPARKRSMSASARKRIAAAQKARWAKYRKGTGKATPAAKPRKKYRLSAEGRAKIVAAAKARAARQKAEKAPKQAK